MAVLSNAHLNNWLVERLRVLHPSHAAELTPVQLESLVSITLTNARSYGFTQEEEFARYVHAAFLIGQDFDADPQLPWAKQILVQPGKSPDARLTILEEAIFEYLDGRTPAVEGIEHGQ